MAVGSALAEALRALTAIPGYNNAAMDGYAVAGDGLWTIVGTVAAGEEPLERPLRPGEAVRSCCAAASGRFAEPVR